jgi:hypothetical protein
MPKAASGYQGSQKSDLRQETPAAHPLFRTIPGPIPEKPWRIIAGPPLTPEQPHGATVPDGKIVDGVPTWEGSAYVRIEASNRRALEAHFDKLDSLAVAVDFCAACGRDDDLIDLKEATGGRVTMCSTCRDNALLSHRYRPTLAVTGATDDLESIPAFLRRDLPPAEGIPVKLAA